MTQSPRASVEAAFDAATMENFGQKYLEMAYANWTETVRTLRRTVLLCVAAVMAFLLLDHSKSGELSVGFLKTSDISTVLTLLPAITSFLLFEAIDLTVANFYYQDVTGALMKKLHPSIYNNDLELVLAPPASFAWGAGTAESLLPPSDKRGKAQAIQEWFGGLVVVAIVLSVVAFLVYAYVRLYGSSHTNVFVVSGSFVFTIFNLVRGGIQVGDAWDELGSHG